MYSTCLFCNKPLGANEVIEQFPVGRRLAFDGARGRLWVVCTRCGRWNLTPIEERWEAIEECERRFRATPMRASTDNIGLARLAEGLELVRVGRPARPEFAAWRYGDQFGRRRRVTMIQAGVGLGALGLVVATGISAGVGIGGFAWATYKVGEAIVKGSPEKVLARVTVDGGETVKVRRRHLRDVRLLADAPAAAGLVIPRDKKLGPAYVRSEDAMRVAGALLPHLNRYGGTREQVQHAVRIVDDHGGEPARLFAIAAAGRLADARRTFGELPAPVALALEMSAHEDAERRALEGELALLESQWREAEEIAHIADNLFLPAGVEEWLTRRRKA